MPPAKKLWQAANQFTPTSDNGPLSSSQHLPCVPTKNKFSSQPVGNTLHCCYFYTKLINTILTYEKNNDLPAGCQPALY
jgi:hypothetical protein